MLSSEMSCGLSVSSGSGLGDYPHFGKLKKGKNEVTIEN